MAALFETAAEAILATFDTKRFIRSKIQGKDWYEMKIHPLANHGVSPFTIIINSEESDKNKSVVQTNPLELNSFTAACFCDLRENPLTSKYQLSSHSDVFLRADNGTVLMVAIECGPEPRAEHYADLFCLADVLSHEPVLPAVNCPVLVLQCLSIFTHKYGIRNFR